MKRRDTKGTTTAGTFGRGVLGTSLVRDSRGKKKSKTNKEVNEQKEEGGRKRKGGLKENHHH